jgi:hypothetical protein
MDLPEPPLTLREQYLVNRARADLKMAQNQERSDRQTLWQRTILPSLLWLVLWFGVCFMGAYFVVWPMRDASLNNRKNRSVDETATNSYTRASSLFLNGQLDSALKTIQEFIRKIRVCPPAISWQPGFIWPKATLTSPSRVYARPAKQL